MSSQEMENVVLGLSHHHHHNHTITETGTCFHDWGAYTPLLPSANLLLKRADVATYIHKE